MNALHQIRQDNGKRFFISLQDFTYCLHDQQPHLTKFP